MRYKKILSIIVVLLFIGIIGILTGTNLRGKTLSFSVVVLPDTQRYSYEYHDIFCSQTEWIVKNKERLNIVFVSQLGDIVQSGALVDDEWSTASKCMGKLDGVVPYGLIPGNHDVDKVDEPTAESKKYNSVFPVDRFSQNTWYKGSYKGNQNNYQVISPGDMKLLFLNLEVDPTDDGLEWANSILKENQNKHVIVTTHAYLYDDVPERSREPHFRSGGNSGENIWNKLIKENCNVFLVLSGHFHKSNGENRLTSVNQCGKPVHQVVQDYQDRPSGGNGLLRIYTFYPIIKKIVVRTYSTISKKYENNTNSFFILNL